MYEKINISFPIRRAQVQQRYRYDKYVCIDIITFQNIIMFPPFFKGHASEIGSLKCVGFFHCASSGCASSGIGSSFFKENSTYAPPFQLSTHRHLDAMVTKWVRGQRFAGVVFGCQTVPIFPENSQKLSENIMP